MLLSSWNLYYGYIGRDIDGTKKQKIDLSENILNHYSSFCPISKILGFIEP